MGYSALSSKKQKTLRRFGIAVGTLGMFMLPLSDLAARPDGDGVRDAVSAACLFGLCLYPLMRMEWAERKVKTPRKVQEVEEQGVDVRDYGVGELFEEAVAVMGAEAAVIWLNAPNHLLDGQKPVWLMSFREGRQTVHKMLQEARPVPSKPLRMVNPNQSAAA